MAGDALYDTSGTYTTKASMPENLKIVYENGAAKQFEETNTFWSWVLRNKKKYTGKQRSFVIRRQQGGNFIVVGEDGYARSPTRRDWIPGYQTVSGYQLYTIGESIPNMENAKNGDGQFEDMDAELAEEATNNMQWHLSRQWLGKGDCVLCKIAAGAVATNTNDVTITVDTTVYAKTTWHMRVGDDISFFAGLTGNGAVDGGSTIYTTKITAIPSSTTFTVAHTPTEDVNAYYVTFNGNRDYVSATDYFREIDGLMKAANTSAIFENINPATTGQNIWKGVSIANSGTKRDFDPSYIYQGVARIGRNGGDVDFLFCSPEMVEIWNQVMASQVRIGSSEVGTINYETPKLRMPSFKGGSKKTIVLSPEMDRLMPPGKFFMGDSTELGALVEIEFKFLDEKLMTRIPRSLMKEGQLCFAGNLYLTRRNVFGVADDFKYTLLDSDFNS